MGSFSFCVKHIPWNRIFSWCIIWFYLSGKFLFCSLPYLACPNLNLLRFCRGEWIASDLLNFLVQILKLKFSLYMSLQNCVLRSFPWWWSQSYLYCFDFLPHCKGRKIYLFTLPHWIRNLHQSCLNLDNFGIQKEQPRVSTSGFLWDEALQTYYFFLFSKHLFRFLGFV